MGQQNIWEILEIAPTDDQQAIRKAYALKLRHCNPEDRPEAFQQLRAAYEEALHPEINSFSIAFEKPSAHPEEVSLGFLPRYQLETPTIPEAFPESVSMVDELFYPAREAFSLQIFEKWIRESRFVNLDLSLHFQEAILKHFNAHGVFFERLFLALFRAFDWESLQQKPSNPLAQILQEIIDANSLESLVNPLEHLPLTLDTLYVAVFNNDLELVKALVKLGVDVAQPSERFKNTLLICAVQNHHLEIMDYLLQQGVDPNQRNEKGQTALTIAASKGFEKAAESLLKAGADVCLYGERHHAFEYALHYGHIALARRLLKAIDLSSEEALEFRGPDGGKALSSKALMQFKQHAMSAFIYGYTDFLDDLNLLVETHVDFVCDPTGNFPVQHEALQPLIRAAGEGDLLTLQERVAEGENVNQTDGKYGYTSLYMACKQGHVACVRYLLACGADPELTLRNGLAPLHSAIQNHHHEIVDCLLSDRADVNRAAGYGFSPLFMAVKFQNKEAFHKLIERGAKDMPTAWFHTALLAAVYDNQLPIVKELIASGSDLQQFSGDGVRTLIYIAALYQYLDVLKYLLSLGLHPDMQPGPSRFNYSSSYNIALTPLTAAVKNNDVDAVTVLLQAGADPNRKSNGSPPLHFVAAKVPYIPQENSQAAFYEACQKSLQIIDFLRAYGADINLTSDGGEPFLIKATITGKVDVALHLIEAGADVNIPNAEGKFAIDYAKQHDWYLLQECLKQAEARQRL